MNLFKSCQARIVSFYQEYKILLRSIPSMIVAFFVVSVVLMNLLANKTIVNLPYLALDGGILVSWISFLSMDIITKHFGPKAATKVSLFAIGVNLVCCLLFYLVSIIPTEVDYSGFNSIFGGTWFILLSSSVAFVASAIINNFMNYGIGKLFKKNPDGKLAFVTRSYISTFIGQFVDNMIFVVLTFMVFAPIFWGVEYSWTFIQCLTCSILGALVELACEIIFSPIGYYICKKWKKEGVGEAYFKYLEAKNNESVN